MAALIGDPARAAMMVALMDGRALTAGELGIAAGVMPPTTSGHLGRMLDAGLLAVVRQGRHRYYRIANAPVAGLVESLMALSADLGRPAGAGRPVRVGPRDVALRRARVCYDHLAGEIAVAMTDRMVERGQLEFGPEGGAVTERGLVFLDRLGVSIRPNGTSTPHRQAFCRPCLDWSERRPHIAGHVGRTLFEMIMREGWARRQVEGRAVTITPVGIAMLRNQFSVQAE